MKLWPPQMEISSAQCLQQHCQVFRRRLFCRGHPSTTTTQQFSLCYTVQNSCFFPALLSNLLVKLNTNLQQIFNSTMLKFVRAFDPIVLIKTRNSDKDCQKAEVTLQIF